MKKILFIFVCIVAPLFSNAQITDTSYQKLPWQECHENFVNFADIFKFTKIEDTLYSGVGLLLCEDDTRIFLRTKDSLWKGLTLPDKILIPSENKITIKFTTQTRIIKFVFKNNNGKLNKIYFSISQNSWIKKEEVIGHGCTDPYPINKQVH